MAQRSNRQLSRRLAQQATLPTVHEESQKKNVNKDNSIDENEDELDDGKARQVYENANKRAFEEFMKSQQEFKEFQEYKRKGGTLAPMEVTTGTTTTATRATRTTSPT